NSVRFPFAVGMDFMSSRYYGESTERRYRSRRCRRKLPTTSKRGVGVKPCTNTSNFSWAAPRLPGSSSKVFRHPLSNRTIVNPAAEEGPQAGVGPRGGTGHEKLDVLVHGLTPNPR